MRLHKKKEGGNAAMKHYIGCDAHKKYSVFVTVNEHGQSGSVERVEHDRQLYRKYLTYLPPASPIAIESVGNWYWMIEEMEKAGHRPILVNPKKAKLLMGQINKTDKLDARGLAMLNLNGSLPAVWIPPAELRDQRELVRMRMSFVAIRTKLKNRIQATLGKYALTIEVSDVFGKQGRLLLKEVLKELPPETQRSMEEHLKLLDQVSQQIEEIEKRVQQIVALTPQMQLLKTLPGVGNILAITIALEIGEVSRFPDAMHLASYAGTVPRINSSGGKTYYGKVRTDINHYLKWAYVEAASGIAAQAKRLEGRHVVTLLRRIQEHKGHPKAIVAVARHLAEASYCMLKNSSPYQEPGKKRTVSTSRG
jgi:transposase